MAVRLGRMDKNLTLPDLLAALSAKSFDAHRAALEVLPALRHHGDQVVLSWLRAALKLFQHDPEAGLAFIRGSYAAEEISETVLPWTEQALAFLQWRSSAPAVASF